MKLFILRIFILRIRIILFVLKAVVIQNIYKQKKALSQFLKPASFSQMPTAQQFIQHTDMYPIQTTLKQQTTLLKQIIDYMSIVPDPLLQNQQQCYSYPNKASEILAAGTVFRVLVTKQQRKRKDNSNNTEMHYPYLDRIFDNILKLQGQKNQEQIEQCLLGYVNKVLISLAKKTPQIYQYFKENQNKFTLLIKKNQTLQNLQEFWTTFIIESTMSLYIFLKNLLIRALMFRVIDESDTNNLPVYQVLVSIYEEIIKKLQLNFLPADEKQQLEQLCSNFHDQDFITLLILKISNNRPQKTYYIGKFLNSVLKNPINNRKQNSTSPTLQLNPRESTKSVKQQLQGQQQQNTDQYLNKNYSFSLKIITENYIEALEQYFEAYQESSNFMDFVLPDQIQILAVLVALSQKKLLEAEYEANLLKRLLVYSSIHKKNSILHCMLYKTITNICEGDDRQKTLNIFKEISVIPFLIKNWEKTEIQNKKEKEQQDNTKQNEQSVQKRKKQQYCFGSLVFKICKYWLENKDNLGELLTQQQLKYIEQQVNLKEKKRMGLQMFKPSLTPGLSQNNSGVISHLNNQEIEAVTPQVHQQNLQLNKQGQKGKQQN